MSNLKVENIPELKLLQQNSVSIKSDMGSQRIGSNIDVNEDAGLKRNNAKIKVPKIPLSGFQTNIKVLMDRCSSLSQHVDGKKTPLVSSLEAEKQNIED